MSDRPSPPVSDAWNEATVAFRRSLPEVAAHRLQVRAMAGRELIVGVVAMVVPTLSIVAGLALGAAIHDLAVPILALLLGALGIWLTGRASDAIERGAVARYLRRICVNDRIPECLNCLYDVHASASSVCPECGSPIALGQRD